MTNVCISPRPSFISPNSSATFVSASRSTMKDEHSSSRCFGQFRERGAAVCVKDEKEEEVLLVTSKRDTGKWVIPGGGVEPGEDVMVAAIREVIEEAGVKGVITRQLGVFVNEVDKNRTSVFVMRVSEELHDWEDARRMGRRRRWFPVAEARTLLGMHKQSQQVYLDRLKAPPVDAASNGTIRDGETSNEESLRNLNDGR